MFIKISVYLVASLCRLDKNMFIIVLNHCDLGQILNVMHMLDGAAIRKNTKIFFRNISILFFLFCRYQIDIDIVDILIKTIDNRKTSDIVWSLDMGIRNCFFPLPHAYVHFHQYPLPHTQVYAFALLLPPPSVRTY